MEYFELFVISPSQFPLTKYRNETKHFTIITQGENRQGNAKSLDK